jgi:hypothetical protein
VISEYVEVLAAKLSFDRSLSRRVRQEVEDHLREAVAVDPAGSALEAERRAIARFGEPLDIAAQFATLSLARQTRRAGVAFVLVILAVFAAMKTRIAWYALRQWALSDDMRAAGGVVASIDAYAFWLSLVVGVAGWAYISICRTPATFQPSYHTQLHRFFVLCTVAMGGLIASVISDGVLTSLRLFGTQASSDFFIPVFSMAIEIAGASVLAFRIRRIRHRVASIAGLVKA